MSAELCRRVQMESNRNIDGVTERSVLTLEHRDAERSRSRRCRNDETTKRADSQRSAQRERKQRRRYLKTVKQTDAQRAVDRSQSQRHQLCRICRTSSRSGTCQNGS